MLGNSRTHFFNFCTVFSYFPAMPDGHFEKRFPPAVTQFIFIPQTFNVSYCNKILYQVILEHSYWSVLTQCKGLLLFSKYATALGII